MVINLKVQCNLSWKASFVLWLHFIVRYEVGMIVLEKNSWFAIVNNVSDPRRRWCRVKLMTGPAPHTQLDADLAAGMGMPDNGPKLMAMWAYHTTLNIFGVVKSLEWV